jgi:trimeric autotransporter adhesin
MKRVVNISLVVSVLICGSVALADDCQPHWNPTIGQPGMNHDVRAFAIFDDGSGPALYAGGVFFSAGGETVNRVAKWDGAAWSPLGDGVAGGWVYALAVFDDGSGPALYTGGTFTHAGGVPASRVAKWDGSTWSALGDGTGPSNDVNALAVFDDGSGPALYVGGRFTLIGDMTAKRIARWDGKEWSVVGFDGVNDDVRSLAVFDDGSGPALYVGGRFTIAIGPDNPDPSGGCVGNCGGQAPEGCWCDEFCCGIGDCCANNCEACGGCQIGFEPCPEGEYVYSIAKWDGDSWSGLDGGLLASSGGFADANAMVVHDGALIVGGRFVTAGSVPVSNIATWDGTAWSPLGSGTSGNVRSLASLVHGEGDSALFAGGAFSAAGDDPASRIARWDGEEWSPLGSGTSHNVLALAAFDGGDGPHLYVGGQFTSAGGEPSNRIARWHDCPTPPTCAPADLNCDGAVDVLDLLILLDAWGPCSDPENCPADLNGDTVVDVLDLLMLLDDWG